jgi:hypothetical protein
MIEGAKRKPAKAKVVNIGINESSLFVNLEINAPIPIAIIKEPSSKVLGNCDRKVYLP